MSKAKELPIEGNLFFIQGISTRCKQTGLYNPFMDGNINITLNRLYANKDNFEKAVISLPMIDRIGTKIFQQFTKFLSDIFDDKVSVCHFNFYGANIDETRRNLFDPKLQDIFVENIRKQALEFYNGCDSSTFNIISDFPILLSPDLINISTIRYNYNWNKASDNDTSFLATLFEQEVELSRKFETFLYSDVQYDYWNEYIKENPSKSLFFRSTNIFSEEYLKLVSNYEIEKASRFDLFKFSKHTFDSLITSILKIKPILFYTSRIEDPRYDFESVVNYAYKYDYLLIVTNPTNVAKETYEHLIKDHYVDLTNLDNKRALYFYILSKLSENDLILRYETDMHISLIEQTILTKARVSHQFSQEVINSYLK